MRCYFKTMCTPRAQRKHSGFSESKLFDTMCPFCRGGYLSRQIKQMSRRSVIFAWHYITVAFLSVLYTAVHLEVFLYLSSRRLRFVEIIAQSEMPRDPILPFIRRGMTARTATSSTMIYDDDSRDRGASLPDTFITARFIKLYRGDARRK